MTYRPARSFAAARRHEDHMRARHHHHSRTSNFAARGEHMLRPHVARAIVSQLDLPEHALVVDIGAGRGGLTEPLAARGFRVVAIERDARLFRSLRTRFIGRTNVECHHADALTVDLPREPYAVVANLPFGITSPIVRRLLEGGRPPDVMWLIVQREAAEKFAGTPRTSLFHVQHAPWIDITIARPVDRNAFLPPPSVGAALIRLAPRAEPWLPPRAENAWRRFVRTGMRGPGPGARHNLRALLTPNQFRAVARRDGFPVNARAGDLTAAHWLGLFRFYELVCVGRRPALLIERARSSIIRLSPARGPAANRGAT
jgi:23S rRNA (adenine-N6)-dimethyltransferase